MIAFTILGGRFSLYWNRLILTVFFVAVLVALGAWQIDRLQEKTGLLHLIEKRTHQSWTDLSVLRAGEDVDYLPVAATGRFNHDNEMYITAINKEGEGGYDVLTPMLLEDGRWLLVNRGWVPYDHKDPAMRQAGQIAGMARVHGLLRLPQKNILMHGRDEKSGIWRAIDLEAMARQGGIAGFLPFVVEADATPNSGNLPVGGQTHLDLPNNHLGYAFTWYGLAFIALFVFLISSWEKLPDPPPEEAEKKPRGFVSPRRQASSPTKDGPPTRRRS